jgi:2-keto-3-deoxy-L-rhamnonate aldolase RhmA
MDNLTPWKEALKERTLYGCFVTYGLPDIAEVTALMGFDFLLLDNEHGVIEQSTLADMVRASQLRGVPAVVRCTMKEYDHIQKALDFGANGVQLPLVNTAEDARRVVELANYAPQGRRGTAYLPRAARYGMVEDKRAYLRQANDTKLVCCQVETRQGGRLLHRPRRPGRLLRGARRQPQNAGADRADDPPYRGRGKDRRLLRGHA